MEVSGNEAAEAEASLTAMLMSLTSDVPILWTMLDG